MTKKTTRVARLVPPHSDKSWSFQMINVSEDDVWLIRGAFSLAEVKAAQPFLQGNSGDWVMVEFWTKDKALIDAAVSALADLFQVTVKEGDFTREDLGFA